VAIKYCETFFDLVDEFHEEKKNSSSRNNFTHFRLRELCSQLLRKFDPMVQEAVTSQYQRLGIQLIKGSHVDSVSKQADNRLKVQIAENSSSPNSFENFDQVVVATGRTPCTERLGLNNVGIATNSTGHIEVDSFQNTSVPGIFAVGDVTTQGWELTPVAIAAGRRQELPPQSISQSAT
jgi:glutathione reductase (NADPH)